MAHPTAPLHTTHILLPSKTLKPRRYPLEAGLSNAETDAHFVFTDDKAWVGGGAQEAGWDPVN